MFRISYSRACQVFIIVLPVLFQKASPLQLGFWKDRAGVRSASTTQAPLETERLSHADGGRSLPISAARLPSVPPPISSALLPSASPQPALLTSAAGESGELADAPPRGRTRAASVSTSPSRKQIPERNGNNQKVPSLTLNSTTRLR